MTTRSKADPRRALHVICGAGPVALAVARSLFARGERVRIVRRTGSSNALATGVSMHCADLRDADVAAHAFAGASVVYHCAAPPYHRWPVDFPPLQRGIVTGAIRNDVTLVAIDNLYGYGTAGRLTEDTPQVATTRKGAVRAGLAAELLDLSARGVLNASIARASDFFGPGVRLSAVGERFWPRVLAGKACHWVGDPDAAHTFTYVDDVASTMVTLGATPSAWGRAWHVPSPPPVSARRFAAIAAEAEGVDAPEFATVSPTAQKLIGLLVPPVRELAEVRYLFDSPLHMDDGAFRARFGGDHTPIRAAIDATLAWWRARGTRDV
ncbi:MAG: NAD-dependent epimerase/dehydratase family protein [Planctomycetota bacterium]